MEANDIVQLEKAISKIVGQDCSFTVAQYDGNKLLELVAGPLRDKLGALPGYYNYDYCIVVKTANDTIASMRMYQLPGCCGVAISSAAWVGLYYRRKGLNTIFNKFRIDLAKHMGYSVLMCSDITSNEPSKKTLVKNGWKDVYQFKNRRSGNVVDLSIINL